MTRYTLGGVCEKQQPRRASRSSLQGETESAQAMEVIARAGEAQAAGKSQVELCEALGIPQAPQNPYRSLRKSLPEGFFFLT